MRAVGQVLPALSWTGATELRNGRESAEVRRIELERPREVFADPTPLGLIGLAIGCAALTPLAFGVKVGPSGLETAAVLCLLFGAGCQLVSGLLNLANKNLLGGTVFTAFAFNWALNGWTLWALAHGTVPDQQILLATEVASLVLFIPLTYAFGFHSSLLFAFLLDIDLLYAAKLAKGYAHVAGLEKPIALLTLGLGLIALWIALAMLVNPSAKRRVFAVPGPLFAAPAQQGFDWSLRRQLFEELYTHWRALGFSPVAAAWLEQRLSNVLASRALGPELEYLAERGAIALEQDADGIKSVRITAAGIDLYEQLVLSKYG